MRLTRRRLLVTAGALSAFAVAERGVRLGSAAIGSAVEAMRPPATGTSTGHCALCGSAEHAMLDARCPRARPIAPRA